MQSQTYYTFLGFFLVLFALPLHASINVNDSLVFQIFSTINNNLDDVEERSDNSIYVNSSDLELIHDFDGGDQVVGLRFNNLQIPKDAEIIEAKIQFTTDDETSNGTCILSISAEDSANAPVFATNAGNISNRQRTQNSINWEPLAWTSPFNSSAVQRTPDLSSIVEEIIEKPAWAEGNAMVFIFEGTGRRSAVAHEQNPILAPRLEVKFSMPAPDAVLQEVYINELMPSNGLVQDEYGEADDWVEIFNGSSQTIFLGGLYLSDDLNDLKKWRISAPKTLLPGDFGLIWLDEQEEQGGLHANFKLNKDGEFVALSQEFDGEIHLLDVVEFPETSLNISYGRKEDGNSEWVHFNAFTPESSNNGQLQFLDEKVYFSKEGGIYPNSIDLSLSTDDPTAVIYYTTDGNLPTINDFIYQGTFSINQTTLIRAAAFHPGISSGHDSSESYFINEPQDLPIISVQTAPENLWDDISGIYSAGTNGINGYCVEEPRNWNQDWERPGNISFFEADGTKGFQTNVGIKIGGGCSRSLKMKGLNFFCRSSRYGDESIKYPVFPNLGISEFKRLKVRNSGNDFMQMLFRDGINQTILYNTVDLDLMAYRPVKVFLNGEYWGVYGLREFFNEDWVASHHGVDPDNIDLIANPNGWAEIKDGDDIAYQHLMDYMQFNDITNPANYNYVKQLMDVNEFINYHIAQVYYGNYDWPANNVRVWRDRDNGKFRWMLFDTDATTNYGWWSASLATDNTIAHATNSIGTGWPNGAQSTFPLRRLLENEAFKNEFIQRTCTFRELLFDPQRVSHMTDSIKAMLEPAMQRHIDRWINDYPELGGGYPSGGSLWEWNNFINTYKSFFSDRQQYILGHYRNTLFLDGTYQLKFIFDENTPGYLYIHENEMTIPYNYEGDYFRNIPIKIKAVAKPGYQFHHWLETGVTEAEIEYSSETHSTLTPVFVPNHPIITEIHYNPKNGDAYEFIELYNASSVSYDLSGMYFQQGVEFEFPNGIHLEPEAYLLVVRDKSKFASLSCQVFEWDSGNLSNNGETIEIIDNQGNRVQNISYEPSNGWPEAANGEGPSLSLKTPFLDNALPESWEAAFVNNGTPCGEQLIEEDNPIEFLLKISPNPATTELKITYASVSSEPLVIQFFNELGQFIYEETLVPSPFLQERVMDVNSWATGVYFADLKGVDKGVWIEKVMVISQK